MKKIITLEDFNILAKQNLQIGLLGGSFNPPHQGHIHISKYAQKLLNLSEIWWIIARQNPLKQIYELDFEVRLTKAEELTEAYPFIKLLTLEQERCFTYSIDVIKFLKTNLPEVKFTWLMGADLALSFDKWHQAETITNLIDIAIFARPGYTDKVKNSILMQKYNDLGNIKFYQIPELDISSTLIRKNL